MTSLAVNSLTSATATLPTPNVSDEEVLVSNSQQLTMSDVRQQGPISYERQLGDNELSYYLPSRAIGVNDMYLHLGFKAPKSRILRRRVRAVWAILRMRHPLLASKVVMRSYEDVRFVFHPPSSAEDALAEADGVLDFRSQSKDGTYPLVGLTEQATDSDDGDRVVDFELFICAAHFIGDGMALHQFANDFFGLLGSAGSPEELEQNVADEWKQRWAHPIPSDTPALPLSSDEKLGIEKHRFRRAAGQIDFQNFLRKQIGGQAFPRRCDPVRHTIVPTTSFKEDLTKVMLKKCKAQGVSISSALFAVCNIAYARMTSREKQELPMMMYAPINIRSYFPKAAQDSYWFLAVGYFNVVLPNFMPTSSDVSETFWHRARKAKEQSSRVASSPLIKSRIRAMAIMRGKQSRLWAKEDDEKAAGTWVPPPPTTDESSAPKHPSQALTGLSLLGNLDGIYKHANFPDIKLHTLTTGSRQRHSGMLIFGYTFAGKLWISFGYDENGFDRETIDLFWGNVHAAVHEFLT
ncbi:hypothetical protein BGW80DRAFT_1160922 [Lactifluus volemus]|nr:hypothetical protein BGW80DRAFT_1160922 [Lactifluus volemus]